MASRSSITLLLPFNCLFSRTTWVRHHQTVRTILDFNETRDDGVSVALAGPHADHLHLAATATATTILQPPGLCLGLAG